MKQTIFPNVKEILIALFLMRKKLPLTGHETKFVIGVGIFGKKVEKISFSPILDKIYLVNFLQQLIFVIFNQKILQSKTRFYQLLYKLLPLLSDISTTETERLLVRLKLTGLCYFL